jgi:hypothetical protein
LLHFFLSNPPCRMIPHLSHPSWWNPCEHSPWRLPECIQGASASSRVREWNTQRSPVKGASFLCLVGFWRTQHAKYTCENDEEAHQDHQVIAELHPKLSQP